VKYLILCIQGVLHYATLCVHCRHAYGGGFGFAHPAACDYTYSSVSNSSNTESFTDSTAHGSILEDNPEAVMQVLTAAHSAGMEVCVTVCTE
jgi:hypothetical protein